MTRFEAILVGCLIAPLAPAVVFFGAWWTSFLTLPERFIPTVALGGLGVGVVLDAVFLRRWTRRAYDLPPLLLAILYVLLSVFLLAVVMGVPVFHPLLGAIAGLYMGRRMRHGGVDRNRAWSEARSVGRFTTTVIVGISALSATIAWLSSSTPSDLQGMFRLPFPITWGMVAALILIGGFALVILQYWLTVKAALGAYRFGCRSTEEN